MEITTLSHINAAHAAGPHFPEAQSADGRFAWHHGAPGYVSISCELTGLTDNTFGKGGWRSVYLQHGEGDPEVSAALLADARAFSQAVSALRDSREQAARRPAAPVRALTAHEAALVARYRTSDAAWDAGDEAAWAILRQLDL